MSVALAAAMAIMVASFRDSVDDWLAQLLPADLRADKASGSGHLDVDLAGARRDGGGKAR